MTSSKLRGVNQDGYLERMHTLQRYLTLLQTYFPAIIPLTDDEIKDACLEAQPLVCKNDFRRSRVRHEDADISELSDFCNHLQSLEPPISRHHHNPDDDNQLRS